MSSNLKALRSLVAMAQRRTEPLEAVVAAARNELARCRDATELARQRHAGAQAALQAIVRERDVLLSTSFVAPALIAMELREFEARDAVEQADLDTCRHRDEEAEQARFVRTAMLAVQRNEQRIDSLRERIEALVRERAEAEQERDEEEAEEASTGRFIARRGQRAGEA